MAIKSRLGLAVLTSSLLNVAGIVGTFALEISVSNGAPISMANLLDGAFYLFLFGWPVALVMTLVIGVPRYAEVAGKPDAAQLRSILLRSTLVTCALFVLIWSGFNLSRSVRDLAWTALPGMAGGFIGGLCFWRVARPPAKITAERNPGA